MHLHPTATLKWKVCKIYNIYLKKEIYVQARPERQFWWSGNLHEFLYAFLFFAPRIFTKLLKTSNPDMLLMGHSIYEVKMCRYSFLLASTSGFYN